MKEFQNSIFYEANTTFSRRSPLKNKTLERLTRLDAPEQRLERMDRPGMIRVVGPSVGFKQIIPETITNRVYQRSWII
jgi:hypothetical protein